ncbi:MAG: 50S ribosomal protein L35 [Patescibacteria group bacterium]
MPKIKTHKATAKRIKITRGKKMMQRRSGQDHFNARESGRITKKKRRDRTINKANVKAIKKLVG